MQILYIRCAKYCFEQQNFDSFSYLNQHFEYDLQKFCYLLLELVNGDLDPDS